MINDCTTRLAQAREALHSLLTGQAVVSVSVEGESVSYAQADQGKLQAYVSQLESVCGGTGNQVMPRRRPLRVVY